MKEGIIGFALGASVGLGMLLCPQVRDFMNKMTAKVEKKVEKMKKKLKEK